MVSWNGGLNIFDAGIAGANGGGGLAFFMPIGTTSNPDTTWAMDAAAIAESLYDDCHSRELVPYRSPALAPAIGPTSPAASPFRAGLASTTVS